MKIAQLIPGSLSQGGIGSLVQQLSESLTKHGHEITVYTLSKELDEKSATRDERRFIVKQFEPAMGDPFYVPPHSLMKDLVETELDIIHVHNLNTLLPAYVASSRNRLQGALILQPHYHRQGQSSLRNLLFSAYKIYLGRSILKRYDAIVANSEHERRTLEKDFRNISQAVTLIPEEYSMTVPPYAEWHPSSQPNKLLYVGILTKYKRVDVLIRAFKILASKRQDSELVIIGSGPEKRKLKQLAEKLEIDEQVIMKENLPREELWRQYSSASAVVVLSSLESFSRVAHEAMAVGVPLVVHNKGVFKEFVERGLAYGTNTLEPHEVAEAINKVINYATRNSEPIQTRDGEMYTIRMLQLYRRLRQRHD